ncbi:RimJ/RimL family protein N-acetyltransferase [Paenibacillus amylolyticus]|uniref:RimJ/RimL family protein N-acetyltransferase n=1 Tax=Paenibacillus amylolyticus TaxID=1451 RepID=A0AAP5H1J1_PAEAM|nr:GNAT family protein [Paenibacillus amylolyticus]MDR6722414.1 RimJ/RimL family protein N-acetyltransferase [Paenibacillus amylolyticus]
MKETPIIEGDLVLRCIEEADLPELYQLIYSEEVPEWKQWDAPYFPLEHESYTQYSQGIMKWIEASATSSNPISMRIVEVKGQIIGTISYYWEHQQSLWLEMGIVLYRSTTWSKGVGTRALQLWSSHLFNHLSIARVGLTTWSGNERMMRAATKAGLQVEGRMRKCRIVEGKHYDSIRMGMLREEWEQLSSPRV